MLFRTINIRQIYTSTHAHVSRYILIHWYTVLLCSNTNTGHFTYKVTWEISTSVHRPILSAQISGQGFKNLPFFLSNKGRTWQKSSPPPWGTQLCCHCDTVHPEEAEKVSPSASCARDTVLCGLRMEQQSSQCLSQSQGCTALQAPPPPPEFLRQRLEPEQRLPQHHSRTPVQIEPQPRLTSSTDD